MTSTLRKHLAMALGFAVLLTAEVTTAVAQTAGPSPTRQLGFTGDGSRSAVVSMSEARGDTPEHILAQENAAGALIDHALCAGGPAGPVTAGDAK
ncbi:hypothetical protein [Streptomyces sp. ME18-1-4]|uniref:hypothetical protein n=1 Tax=Streptomyces sp. ME18-1-4 TaxID=3028685 RepID=UPI0029AADECD|nr:hypothetical protein [Streptomyces sp. ME18-1-4]MDX3245893.1 hypothetical protein [Streptomyces sp. ME18-1-4]